MKYDLASVLGNTVEHGNFYYIIWTTIASWYNWNDLTTHNKIYQFFKGIIKLRKDHAAFTRTNFYTGTDHDGDGIPDIQWHGAGYKNADFSATSRALAWRIDGSKAETGTAVDDNDFYVIANHGFGVVTFQLPPNHAGKKWYRVLDTAGWAESGTTIANNIDSPGTEDVITDGTWTNTSASSFAGNSSYTYNVNARSMVVFIQK
ncbi:MAG: hypothetical protein N3B21_15850 [Clostridia bacterium]|nr:hypothetical protein [Clostridia bacterium]